MGTVFNSTRRDMRLELKHGALGPLKNVIGVQAENFDFSALGDESVSAQDRYTQSRIVCVMGVCAQTTGASTPERARKGAIESAGRRCERCRSLRQRQTGTLSLLRAFRSARNGRSAHNDLERQPGPEPARTGVLMSFCQRPARGDRGPTRWAIAIWIANAPPH